MTLELPFIKNGKKKTKYIIGFSTKTVHLPSTDKLEKTSLCLTQIQILYTQGHSILKRLEEINF